MILVVDLHQPILNLQQEPLTKPGSQQPVTYLEVALNALTATMEGEELPLEAKAVRYQLANRLQRPGSAQLSLTEAWLLLSQVAKLMPSSLVVGRFLELLEGQG